MGSESETPVGARDFLFSTPVETGTGAHPASCATGTGSLSRGLSGQGVALTTHPRRVPSLRMNRAVPLLPVCTSMACYWETFTFIIPPMMHINIYFKYHQRYKILAIDSVFKWKTGCSKKNRWITFWSAKGKKKNSRKILHLIRIKIRHSLPF
jgi:hypothetical protein